MTLQEHLYAVPLVSSENHLFDFGSQKTFYADRYGGQGNGDGGGSGRCASDGQLQVKGIGKTPLARNEDNFFHSYGGLSVAEAVLEAIWGEVCTMALPFGGVRTVAIALTGSDVPVKFKRSKGPATVPRAIAIRESVLRPAHFMRAIYYSNPSEKYPGFVDAARTSEAISVLSRSLAHISVTRSHVQSGSELGIALRGMFRRFALQIAAARAKRIMHGSLTASNVALDGRWLDFGSISTVGDYAKIIIPRGAPHFLAEERLVLRTIADLVFYVHKFLPAALSSSETQDYFVDAFLADLDNSIVDAYCELSGASAEIISSIPLAVRCAYADILRELINEPGQRAILILSVDNDVRPVMPERVAENHIPTILRATAFCRTEEDYFAASERHIASLAHRRRFARCAASLREAALHAGSNALIQSLRCIQRNCVPTQLYRTNLYPEVDDLVEQCGDVGNFIDKKVGVARSCYEETDLIPLAIPGMDIYYDVNSGAWLRQGCEVDLLEIRSSLAAWGLRFVPEGGGNAEVS